MDQSTAFKSRLLGFDKKMVLDYILKFSQQVQTNEEQLTGHIRELEALRTQLERQLAEHDVQMTDLMTKYTAASAQSTESQGMLEKLGDEVERLRTVVSEKDREIQIQNERCRQLQFKVESLEQRSKREPEAPKPQPQSQPGAQAPAPAVEKIPAAVVNDADAEVRRLKSELSMLTRRVETLESRTVASRPANREESFFRNRTLPR